MAVKFGYRQTEVGVIPEEWEVKPLQEVGKFAKGKGLLKEDIKTSGRIPAIPYTALYTDFSELLNYDHIKWFVDDEAQTYIANEPCVLIASSSNMTANTGKASALTRATPVAIGREVIIFKTASDCSYISYLLGTTQYRQKTLSLARGTTIKHLYPTTFKNYRIALPSLSEQRAIATALSDIDALLGALERLIAKKRDLKQAAMQKLLTGQTRLPGFSAEWTPTTLGEVATFLSGGTPSRGNDAYWNGNIPWISATSLRCFEIWRSDSNVTEEAVASGSKIAPLGSTLLLVRGSALHKEILCGLVTKRVCFNQDVKALVPHCKVFPRFLTTLIKGRAEEFLKLVSSAGNTAGVLDTKLLRAFEFLLPGLPEQNAIANVLTDMDTELAALEQRLTKTRALKQGMMQELLTGRTRLL